MELILKAVGLFLVLSVSTLTGFFKAHSLKERQTALSDICISLKELKERIRIERSDISYLLKTCFRDSVNIEGGITKEGLNQKDKELLCEYLNKAGMADAYSECERISVYITLFEERLASAAEESARLCKLYRSSGFLIGLFICIFII